MKRIRVRSRCLRMLMSCLSLKVLPNGAETVLGYMDVDSMLSSPALLESASAAAEATDVVQLRKLYRSAPDDLHVVSNKVRGKSARWGLALRVVGNARRLLGAEGAKVASFRETGWGKSEVSCSLSALEHTLGSVFFQESLKDPVFSRKVKGLEAMLRVRARVAESGSGFLSCSSF